MKRKRTYTGRNRGAQGRLVGDDGTGSITTVPIGNGCVRPDGVLRSLDRGLERKSVIFPGNLKESSYQCDRAAETGPQCRGRVCSDSSDGNGPAEGEDDDELHTVKGGKVCTYGVLDGCKYE